MGVDPAPVTGRRLGCALFSSYQFGQTLLPRQTDPSVAIPGRRAEASKQKASDVSLSTMRPEAHPWLLSWILATHTLAPERIPESQTSLSSKQCVGSTPSACGMCAQNPTR